MQKMRLVLEKLMFLKVSFDILQFALFVFRANEYSIYNILLDVKEFRITLFNIIQLLYGIGING